MVITMLAIVAGLMVLPAQRIKEALQARPLEEIVLASVRKAHSQARQLNVPVVLAYHAESNRLEICTRDGVFLEEVAIPLPDDAEAADAPLQFYRLLPEDPKLEDNAFESEDEPVHSILFHPAGASTPFAVVLTDRKNPVRMVLDPFSSEPVLREVEGEI